MSAESFRSIYPQSVLKGAVFIVGSALFFSAVGAMVKQLTGELPVPMVVFFRSFLGLLILTPWLWQIPSFTFRTQRLKDHAFRALVGVCAMYLFFFALSRLHLAVAIMLNFTAPLFIPVVAAVWLREPLQRRIIAFLLVGFCGVLAVLQPTRGGWEPAAIAGLVSSLFAAVALVGVRNLSSSEPAARTVFYFGVFASVVSLPAALWVWVPPTPRQWGLALLIGFCATIGQWLITRGYSSAPAGKVGYYQYTSVIFATGIGWIVWGEIPNGMAWLGGGLILAAGIAASGYRWGGLGTVLLSAMPFRTRSGHGKDSATSLSKSDANPLE